MATTTIFMPNWKQALFNPDQEDGHWPGPYLGFPENGHKLHQTGVYKGKLHKAIELPAFVQLGTSKHPDIPAYVPPPTCDPACPGQFR